jgi:Uma2 family endonuclease
MTAMTVMPRGAAEWTVDDLDLLPDDGLQYELLDGLLLVSPSPTKRHQRAGGKLFILLSQACPPDMEVLFALDWRPDRLTSLQPDVLVVGDTDLDTVVGETMILAVEILSPSTRRKDLFLKRSKYQDAGVPSYWIIDPAAPSITALELVDGQYMTVAEAFGDEAAMLEKPFPVTIVPASLIKRPQA